VTFYASFSVIKLEWWDLSIFASAVNLQYVLVMFMRRPHWYGRRTRIRRRLTTWIRYSEVGC